MSKPMPQRVRAGDLNNLKRRLWGAILRADRIVADDDQPPEVVLRAVSAMSTACGVYRGLLEASDLEARLAALEEKARSV